MALAAATTLTLLMPFSALPVWAEPDDGNVTGRVVNRTPGSGSPADASVLLITFGRQEQAPLGQRTTQTDGTGSFAFTGVDRDPNLVYLTLTRYADVNYSSDEFFELPDAQSVQADIAIYEPTTDDRALQLEQLNLLLLGTNAGMLQFMEMGVLTNTGDRTFVTPNPPDRALGRAVRFALPRGALSVQMQLGFDSVDIRADVGGIQVTSPLPPGQHEFALSFQLPYTGSSADVTLQLPYPTAAYSIYLPNVGPRLDNSALAAAGSAQLGGQSYVLYSASNLPRTAVAAGQLTGVHGAEVMGPNQLALLSLGVVIGVLVLGRGSVWYSRRDRRAPTAASDSTADPEQERLELVVRIAALDDRFAAGEVTRAAYQAERRHETQRLRELTLQHRRDAGGGA
jgi:hypothetical protein